MQDCRLTDDDLMTADQVATKINRIGRQEVPTGDNPASHRLFAEHITAEYPVSRCARNARTEGKSPR